MFGSSGNGLITLNPKRTATSGLACVSELKYVPADIPSLKPFLDALDKAGKSPSDAFYSVPSPGTLALFCENLYFKSHTAYVNALGKALRQEYQRIAATGLQLQVDCPDLAMGRHTRWSSLSDEEFVEVAKANIAALNEAVADVPVEQVRVHVCWGNYAGPHHKDMPADLVWPLLGTVKTTYVLVEGANSRHRNDIEAFERAVKNGHFRPDQVIVPGMLDTTSARVENPELIASTLLEYVRIVGDPSRVMAGTDCGFASTAKSVAVTGDIAWMKLAALAEGARLATQRYLEGNAPVPVRDACLTPTAYRVAIIASKSDEGYAKELSRELSNMHANIVEVFNGVCFEALRWAVDVPLTLLAIGMSAVQAAESTQKKLQQDKAVSRRPSVLVSVGAECSGLSLSRGSAQDVAAAVRDSSMRKLDFDKRSLVLPRTGPVPIETDVVVVGAGLLGMLTAKRCLDAGFRVAVLEQRPLVGGIWSMYANSFSQVNSSEGGYCIKELICEENGVHGDNRDHSTAAEILKDFAKLGDSLREHIYTSVKVVKADSLSVEV